MLIWKANCLIAIGLFAITTFSHHFLIVNLGFQRLGLKALPYLKQVGASESQNQVVR